MHAAVRRRRLTAVLAAATGVVLATALPATAHVTVDTPDAEPGEFGKVVFRVPNESETADTTKLKVTLPAATPFAFVSTKTQPGWRVQTSTEKLEQPVKTAGFTITEAVRTITWTATKGNAIPPHQFMEFEVSGGPFPTDVSQMTFPATQTYSDGEVVAWDDVVKEGAPEPEHPAPILELGATSTQSVAATSSSQAGASEGTTSAVDTAAADTSARTMSAAALVLAAGALVWSILAGRRARS